MKPTKVLHEIRKMRFEEAYERWNEDRLDKDALSDFRDALDYGCKSYNDVLQDGASEAQARQAMHGGYRVRGKPSDLLKFAEAKSPTSWPKLLRIKAVALFFVPTTSPVTKSWINFITLALYQP